MVAEIRKWLTLLLAGFVIFWYLSIQQVYLEWYVLQMNVIYPPKPQVEKF